MAGKQQKGSQTYYLSEETLEAVGELATKTGTNKSRVVEDLLAEGIGKVRDDDRPTVVVVANYKGGVGKTTTAVNLAVDLARGGDRVLIIDLDGQSNASQCLRVYDEEGLAPGIADVLLKDAKGGRMPLEDAICPTDIDGLDAVRSSLRFGDADARLRFESTSGLETRLCRAIQDLPDDARYDFVVIDCPPSLSLVTTNALVAMEAGNARSLVVIPFRADSFAIKGLESTVEALEEVSRERRSNRRNWRVLRTAAERNTTLYRECTSILKDLYKDKESLYFSSVIDKAVVVTEASSVYQPLSEYAPNSRAAKQYRAFAEEIRGL